MRFATPVSRQLHASAASLGSLAAASQAQSLPNLKSYFTPSTPFPQLLASSHEPLHAQGLPFVKGGGPSLGSHTWPSCQVRLQPDLGLLRFLNDKDDSSHAYTNGLTTQADRQHVLAALSEKFETSLTIANTPSPYDPLASETPDEHPNECTKTTLPPLHCGEQPVHRSSLAAQSMCGSTSSIASSHSSLTSVRVFSEKSECTSMQSSLATIFSQAHEQDEVIVLATLGDKSNEDRNLGQEDNLAAEPHIPKDHFGDEFECSFALEEEAFEDWIDHIIQYHLVHGTVQQISCPYCPEQLLEGAEISHDRAVIKQRLEHLRTHSPWLESRCAWPVYVQYAQTCPSGDTSATSRPATSARIDDCPKLPHDDGEQSSHRQRVSNRIKHAKDEGLDQDCSKTSAQPNHASPIASQQANGVRHHGLGSGKGSGGHPPASAPSDEAALPPQPNGGRRRQGLSRDDAGDDGDDERSQHPRDNDKPMHHGTVRVTRREVALKYACPFFKHDDQRFMDCAYTAVQDFQGIKKHLSKIHTDQVPNDQCETCHQVFRRQEDFDAHTRGDSAVVCLPAARAPGRLPILTHKALHGLIKAKTDKEKWEELYRLLYPQDYPVPVSYSGTYEHIKHAPIIQALESSVYASVPADCADLMASCLPAPMAPAMKIFGACLVKTLSQHLLGKSKLFEFEKGTTEFLVSQCHARWNDMLAELTRLNSSQNNAHQNGTQGSWIAEIPLAVESGFNQLQPAGPGTDSGYGTGPNTYNF